MKPFTGRAFAMTNNPEKRLRSVLIVGGGTAGWITAIGLSSLFKPDQISIRLIESEAIGTVGVGEATVPHIRHFNQRVGLDEATFMRRTSATFKLGIEFCDWGAEGERYIHPFGDYGQAIAGVGFHHHWLRARHGGDATPICDYSLPVKLAQANRFALPSSDQASLHSTFSFAYQFDAALYAAYLREESQKRGVVRTEGRIVKVDQDAASGYVTGVVLESGERAEADLYIDCSGFRGLLIEEALQTGYHDWSAYLPCDRAWAVPCETVAESAPFTRATAREAGWQWRIPLQHRVGNGYVFSTRFTDEARARDLLMANLEGPAQAEPKLLRFKTGMRKKSWNKNVVSVGLSSGFLEPLESTSIHLIQLAVTYLAEILPDRDFRPEDEAEYNRTMSREYESVRDFLILHYHATRRTGQPFWDYVRTMDIPASLKTKMDLFKSRGVVVGFKEGFFLEPSWLAVYLGQGVVPDDHDPLSARLSDTQLHQKLEAQRAAVTAATAAYPKHGDFLARYCPFEPGNNIPDAQKTVLGGRA
jgi:tryptophan 7-halogenase